MNPKTKSLAARVAAMLSFITPSRLNRGQAVALVLITMCVLAPAFANPLQQKVEKVLTALEGAAVALLAIGLIRLGIEWAQGGSATRDNMYQMAFAASFILGARALATYLN